MSGARVVVVGGGVGGLAAAGLLAAAGHRVVLCEQADVVGGKLGRHEVDGFRFDTGPHLLTLPHLLADTLDGLGVRLGDVLDLVEVDGPQHRYRFGDGTVLDVPRDRHDLRAALDETLGPGTGARWLRLLDRGERVWAATATRLLGREVRGLRTFAALAATAPREIGVVSPARTLRAVGAGLGDPRARRLLDRYATYSGSDPRHAPAALLAVPHVEQAFGTWYVRGGLGRVGDVLHRAALDHGVDVRLGTAVEQVEVAGGRVHGVRLADGGRLAADVVVVNADAAALHDRLLPPRVARRERASHARAPRSYSGLAVLLGLRGTTPDQAHHTVLHGTADYDDEFDALRASRVVADPAVYLSVPPDASLAPDGHESWFVLVNAPRHGDGTAGTHRWTPAGREAEADRVLDLMAARGTDVRDRVVVREVLSPADLERRTGTPGGGIYGTSSDGPAAAFLRPRTRSAVGGLVRVGGSAHPGGGLPMVLLGARVAADVVGPARRGSRQT